MEMWLAEQTNQPALASRLKAAAQAAVGRMPAPEITASRVPYVHYPVASPALGHVAEDAEREITATGAELGKLQVGIPTAPGTMRVKYKKAER
jgi:hypothetical protein